MALIIKRVLLRLICAFSIYKIASRGPVVNNTNNGCIATAKATQPASREFLYRRQASAPAPAMKFGLLQENGNRARSFCNETLL